MLAKVVADNPGCDGVLLGSHGLFTWGNTQRECYLNSVQTIDQMGEFILSKQGKGELFGGLDQAPLADRKATATAILPALRGIVSSNKRVIAHYTDHEDALAFAGSKWAKELGDLGTSCPDHFLRTRICPMFVDWKPGKRASTCSRKKSPIKLSPIAVSTGNITQANAITDSPKLARFKSIGCHYSGAWLIRVWQKQKRSQDHNGIFYQCNSRDVWREYFVNRRCAASVSAVKTSGEVSRV
jgi:DNA-directed RNA polymerase subunit M/transcription elongation factor TFIIS